VVGAMMQHPRQRGACVTGVGVGGVLDVVASLRVRMQTVGRKPFAFHESKAAFTVTRNSSSCRRTPAFPIKNVKSDKRSEPFDQLKLKLARREASILRSQETMSYDRLCVVSAVASQALQDKAALLFARICVNPKVLSPEAAEFMLTVSASHTTLSPSESESASQTDLILRGVHPTSFQPVLLVCTTTMFATPIAQSDVEKAQRRGELWQRAVGAAFLVVPVVAGYAVSTEVGDFSKAAGVVCCDISK